MALATEVSTISWSHAGFVSNLKIMQKKDIRLEICQNIYTTKFSCVRILHIENA